MPVVTCTSQPSIQLLYAIACELSNGCRHACAPCNTPCLAVCASLFHGCLAPCLVGFQCSFFEHRSYKIIYRRYASLFFMVGVDDEEVSSSACHCPACSKSYVCVSMSCCGCNNSSSTSKWHGSCSNSSSIGGSGSRCVWHEHREHCYIACCPLNSVLQGLHCGLAAAVIQTVAQRQTGWLPASVHVQHIDWPRPASLHPCLM